MPSPRLQALLLYAGIALYLFYPAWTSPAHGVVGDWTHPDALGNHWLYQWIPEQLWQGESILHNDRYYWPVGDAPFLAGNGSDAVPFALLGGWIAWPFSVTLWCLFTVVLNGMSGYAVARAAGVGGTGALVTGAFLVFCPYVARELSAGRFAQAGLYTSGFFLASWLHLLERPDWKRGLVAGLWFSFCAFQYWYYGLWMAMAGAVFWAVKPSLRPLRYFVPVALAGTLPPLSLFLSRWSSIPGVEELEFPHPITYDHSLGVLFPLWSGYGALSTVTLPFVLSAFAVLGWPKLSRRLRAGAVIASLLFFALCLGPELQSPDGDKLGVPGPFTLLYNVSDTLRRFWWPYRHIAPLTVVLLPLAAHGAERALRWLNLGAAPLLIILVLPIELYARGAVVEVSSSWFSAPAGYQVLSERPGEHLLELPLYEKIARNESSLSYQGVHGKTLVNGHAMWVDRVRPTAWDEWIKTQPLLDAIRRFEAGELTGEWMLGDDAPWTEGSVDYITINREYYPGELAPLAVAEASLLTTFFGPPVSAKGRVATWDVSKPPLQREYTFPAWTPPGTYVSTSGMAALPETVRAAGWLNWARVFPPAGPARTNTLDESELRYSRLPPMLRRKLERESESADTGTPP